MAGRLGNCAAAIMLVAGLASSAIAANQSDLGKARSKKELAVCLNCDLSGANLEDELLQLANLIGTNLSGAKLDGANLAGAQLNNANMQRASMVLTNLSGARMEGADLRGADLSKAWLNWAWLAGAKLDGANFSGAKMIGAQLQGADLSRAIGLTSEQLETACADSTTRLPPGVARPYCPY